jgi:hypothetical protein
VTSSSPQPLPPLRVVLTQILNDPTIEPKINSSVVDSLSEKEIHQLISLLNLEFERRDKEMLSNFFGNEQTVTILKEMINILYAPLLEM